jgi:hypothetical protein
MIFYLWSKWRQKIFRINRQFNSFQVKYIDRIDKVVAGYKPPIHDFTNRKKMVKILLKNFLNV